MEQVQYHGNHPRNLSRHLLRVLEKRHKDVPVIRCAIYSGPPSIQNLLFNIFWELHISVFKELLTIFKCWKSKSLSMMGYAISQLLKLSNLLKVATKSKLLHMLNAIISIKLLLNMVRSFVSKKLKQCKIAKYRIHWHLE